MKNFLKLLIIVLTFVSLLSLFSCADSNHSDSQSNEQTDNSEDSTNNTDDNISSSKKTMSVKINGQANDFFYMELNGKEIDYEKETLYEICYPIAYKTDKSSYDVLISFDKPLPVSCSIFQIVTLKKSGDKINYDDINIKENTFDFNTNTANLQFDLGHDIAEDVLVLIRISVYWENDKNGVINIGIVGK